MKDRKAYFLDTSVFLSSETALQSFDDNAIFISREILDELDASKTKSGDIGYNAREAIRQISEILGDGGNMRNGGYFEVIDSVITRSGATSKKDSIVCTVHNLNRIIEGKIKNDGSCRCLANTHITKFAFVTNDPMMRILADIWKIPVEEFKTNAISSDKQQFTGRCELLVAADTIDKLYRDGEIPLDTSLVGTGMQPNEFVLLRDVCDERHTGIGRVDQSEKKIIQLYAYNTDPRIKHPWGIEPKNLAQKYALDALLDPNIPLVIMKGPAGTAKTFLSLAAGLEQTVNQGLFTSILACRPNISFDKDIGFLPGTEVSKISALMRPVYDNLNALSQISSNGKESRNYAEYLFDKGYIVVQAMNFLRGRSLTKTYLLIDEAQNATQSQIFGIISRVGEGSKVVIVGDPDQIDNPLLDKRNNGLVYASERMKGDPLCAQITFDENECVRSPLALAAIKRMSPKSWG